MSSVERQIQEAIERGEFDNLPSAGKPLDLSDADDPNWFAKRLIEREQLDSSIALPAVFRLRREHELLPDATADLPTEQAVRELVADYNHRVKEERLVSVSQRRPMPVLAPIADEEKLVELWRSRRTRTSADRAASDPTAAAPTAAAQLPGRRVRSRRWWRRRRTSLG